MLCEAERAGAADVVGGLLRQGRRVPGFGHKIYRTRDPRVDPLLAAARGLDADAGRVALVDRLLGLASARVTAPVNVDFAIGSLAFVAGVPELVGLFPIARIAGWLAHASEEYAERPVRFRGAARYAGPAAPTGATLPM